MVNKMKAVVMETYGFVKDLKIQWMPIPEPKENEILIKIYAASFNPADYALLQGNFGEILSLEAPHILGLDVSGVISKVHESVENFKIGDSVYAYVSIVKNGSYAEYMVINTKDVAPMPKGLTYEEAAATPLASLTAIQGIYEQGNFSEKEAILILGASGAVGIFAIQLAVLKGAKIYASCSKSSAHLLENYSLEQTIDYHTEKLDEKIPEKLDIIFNLAPIDSKKLKELLPLLKEGGRLISALGIPDIDEEVKKRYILKAIKTKRGGERLQEITTLIEQRKVIPTVTSTWTLEQVKDLFTQYENHVLQGKAVISLHAKGFGPIP